MVRSYSHISFTHVSATFCVVSTLILTWTLESNVYLALSPLPFVLSFGMHLSLFQGFTLAFVWALWSFLLFYPLYYFIGRWVFPLIYLPILLVAFKKPHQVPSALFVQMERWCWDYPLMLWMYILSRFELRALEPFLSHIDDSLAIGSMPLPGDGKLLAFHGVGAVVNMCEEFSGLDEEYKRHSIIQFRVPTLDVCEPSYDKIIQAICFMKEYRAQYPHKKIFVHCKGGRARAVTMGLCYLMSLGHDINDAIDLITSKRSVAERSTIYFRVVRRFKEEYFEDDIQADTE